MPAVATIPVNPTLAQRLAGLDQGQRMRLALGVVLVCGDWHQWAW